MGYAVMPQANKFSNTRFENFNLSNIHCDSVNLILEKTVESGNSIWALIVYLGIQLESVPEYFKQYIEDFNDNMPKNIKQEYLDQYTQFSGMDINKLIMLWEIISVVNKALNEMCYNIINGVVVVVNIVNGEYHIYQYQDIGVLDIIYNPHDNTILSIHFRWGDEIISIF